MDKGTITIASLVAIVVIVISICLTIGVDRNESRKQEVRIICVENGGTYHKDSCTWSRTSN